MSKIYYPFEEAINNIFNELNIVEKNSYDMTNEELIDAEVRVSKYVDWVKHPDYMQMVPKLKSNGKLILPD